MVGRSVRFRQRTPDYWPGFVDALATLLLVIIFLLSIFMLAQFFLNQALTGRDEALARLNTRIAELSELLALEQSTKAEMESQLETLSASLNLLTQRAEGSEAEASRLSGLLGEAEALGEEAQDQVRILNEQIAALRLQIASLQEALDASEARDIDNKVVIANLGKRLNAALAQKVHELTQYRSDFFGKLREALGDRSDIEIVGDRFVFQSEVLFASGSADINDLGKVQLGKVATALIEISGAIPSDVDWVLRVDGHTDRRPIRNSIFPSNWELSSARAISVVRFLITQGVPAKRLVAAGFGEFQPIDGRQDELGFRRNRRIELKLTQR
jgi:chemotaxis protein MotB